MLGGHRRQLLKDLKDFYESLDKEERWTTFGAPQDKQDILNVLLFGPPNTPYEDGTFWIHVEFPKKYPLDPPILTMKTKIHHPIINKKGKICLTMLEDWEKDPFIKCLEAVYDAMQHPLKYSADAISDDVLMQCVQYPEQFEEKAREYTKKFAMSEV